MSTSLKHYLTTLEAALKAGNATEHTHRPAPKALLESMDLGLTATNEPKRGGFTLTKASWPKLTAPFQPGRWRSGKLKSSLQVEAVSVYNQC